jgi:hypothetical protein
MNEASGGPAAISLGLSAWVLLLVLAIVLVGGWKLLQLLWVMFN